MVTGDSGGGLHQHRMVAGATCRSERAAQTLELPGGLCTPVPTADLQSPVVEPPAGSPADRRSSQQRSGSPPVVCIHRGIGPLGRSRIDEHRHDSHLWPPGQPQSPGGVSPSARPFGRDRSDALAGFGAKDVCGTYRRAERRRRCVHLQPWWLAGAAGNPGCTGALVAAAEYGPLAAPLATTCSPWCAVDGGSACGARCHSAGADPNARGEPCRREGGQLEQFPHQRLAGGA